MVIPPNCGFSREDDFDVKSQRSEPSAGLFQLVQLAFFPELGGRKYPLEMFVVLLFS